MGCSGHGVDQGAPCLSTLFPSICVYLVQCKSIPYRRLMQRKNKGKDSERVQVNHGLGGPVGSQKLTQASLATKPSLCFLV